jgi:DNA/RNA-binding domain of Phe-tRNA-synthetase-like protein
MKIYISESVFSIFPEIKIKGIIIKNLNISYKNSINFESFLSKEFQDSERLIKEWKTIYKKFPSDKKARCSIEYLMNSANKGKLKNINSIVDLYNFASLLSLSPFGGENVLSLNNELSLTTALGNEPFISLGKSEIQKPLIGELIWKDGLNRVVCRSLNWIESEIHKITDESRQLIFISEQPNSEVNDSTKGIEFIEKEFSKYSESIMKFELDQKQKSITF